LKRLESKYNFSSVNLVLLQTMPYLLEQRLGNSNHGH
jgi:hypothetical protein